MTLRTFHRGDFEGFGLGMKFDIRGVRAIFLGLDPKSEKFYMQNFFFGHFHLESHSTGIYSDYRNRFQSIAKESVYRNKITASEKHSGRARFMGSTADKSGSPRWFFSQQLGT